MWMLTPTGTVGLMIVFVMASGGSTDITCLVGDVDGACHSRGASMMQTKAPATKSHEEAKLRIVRYKNSKGKLAADAADASGHGVDLHLLHTEVILATDAEVQSLRENTDIDEVEDDAMNLHAALYEQGEEIAGLQRAEETPYGIDMVRTLEVPFSAGNDLIKVCVIDTGYELGHPDLPSASVTGSKPADYSGSWSIDGHGHGTHCAGTIAAVGGNGRGVVGVMNDSSKFSLHIGKGLTDSGSGSQAGVLFAVEKCVEAGSKVISMSLGGGGYSTAAAKAYRDAYEDQGVLIIAAAGNGGNSAYSYPASYPHVVSVAAVTSNEVKASFSQWNNQVEIAGPGVGVKSTWKGNTYKSISGTSMATPHVAGVAAKVWSNFPHCTNQQIRNVLLLTAKDKGDQGCDNKYGYGIVDAKAAYDLLKRDGCDAGNTTEAAVGGCMQLERPTPPPTCEDTCDSRSFQLNLTTDNYGQETSWTLREKGGNELASGSGYESSQQYTVSLCLANMEYEFTINDAYSDGICCGYGNGAYSLSVDGQVVRQGGQFGASETTQIDKCRTTLASTSVPSTTQPPAPMHRLLKGCSRTSKPVREVYGEPRLEFDSESAGEVICCDSGKAVRKVEGVCLSKGYGEAMKTFNEALAICTSKGLGLCQNQAEIDTACSKGCGLNRALAWSLMTS